MKAGHVDPRGVREKGGDGHDQSTLLECVVKEFSKN